MQIQKESDAHVGLFLLYIPPMSWRQLFSPEFCSSHSTIVLSRVLLQPFHPPHIRQMLDQEILELCFETVSRHRQEILSKLMVRNSIEACHIAKDLKLI